MTQLFITSDEHIGHGPIAPQVRPVSGIIALAKRPFKDLDEMKHTLITNHNKKVPNSQGVLTVHVGDLIWNSVTLDDGMDYINQLNGRHAFLFGNHDEWVARHAKLLLGRGAIFDFIWGENKCGGTKIFHYDKMSVTVDHFAKRVWQGSHKGHGHVYGHSHSALPGLGRSFDIGVDGNNFTPWAIEEIVARLRTLTPHHTINNTGEGMTEDIVNENLVPDPLDGSTVHYHKAGETCGFCKVMPSVAGVVKQWNYSYPTKE